MSTAAPLKLKTKFGLIYAVVALEIVVVLTGLCDDRALDVGVNAALVCVTKADAEVYSVRVMNNEEKPAVLPA